MRTRGRSDPSLVRQMMDYRIANGLTQPQFAARAGIAASTVSHLELNPEKSMSRSTMLKIVYALSGGIVGRQSETTTNNE